MTNRSHL